MLEGKFYLFCLYFFFFSQIKMRAKQPYISSFLVRILKIPSIIMDMINNPSNNKNAMQKSSQKWVYKIILFNCLMWIGLANKKIKKIHLVQIVSAFKCDRVEAH